MLPLALLPQLTNTAVQAGKGIYDASDAERRRQMAMDLAKRNAHLDLLQTRASEVGAPTYAMGTERALADAQRQINLTPSAQLPSSSGASPTFDPTTFLPLVTAGANLAGGISNAVGGANPIDDEAKRKAAGL